MKKNFLARPSKENMSQVHVIWVRSGVIFNYVKMQNHSGLNVLSNSQTFKRFRGGAGDLIFKKLCCKIFEIQSLQKMAAKYRVAYTGGYLLTVQSLILMSYIYIFFSKTYLP